MTPQEYSNARAAEMQKKTDMDNLTMAVALEARGEGMDGMFGVARSILNRHRLINSGEVPPYTFMPNSLNKKPTISEIIFYPNQYQVYDSKNKKFKPQKSPVTEEDLKNAQQAIYLASDTERAVTYIMNRELPMELFDATGFRRRDAKYDASQDKNTFMVGNHQFNLAGQPFLED
jgi:hypothetical protein